MKQTGKDFDCVAMKDAIQARLVARRRGMNAVEFVTDVERTLAQSSAPIAEFWRRISAGQTPKPRGRVVAGL